MRAALVIAALLLGSFAAQAVARADETPEGALEIDNCPVPPSEDAAAVRALASEHYDRGGVLYFQGDYDGAIHEFVAALCLLPTATDVLYTIGQSYERLLQFERAIAYYQRYAVTLDDKHAAEKQNVESRITVLQHLRARIQVTTTPPGADVSFTDAAGVRRAFGKPGGDPFQIEAGTYTMRIELPGYQVHEETITPRIGQPYSYYVALEQRTGKLIINTDPPDARIFVDDKLVGIGRYVAEVPGQTYKIDVESNNRMPAHRTIEVVADRDSEATIKLADKPSSGRKQLLVASSIGGALLGGLVFGVLDTSKTGQGSLGAAGGLALGFAGSYFGVPDDISVGSSSYIITSGIVGGLEAGFASGVFLSDPSAQQNSIGAVSLGGMAVGAGVGILTEKRFHFDAGDAALLNSGALWGSVAGGLFGAIFEFKGKVWEGLVLGGLNLGVVSGALLGRQVEVSRGHVALIDLSGFAGMGVSVAIQSAIDDARSTTTMANGERTAHFALAGMAVGLTAGAYFTRHMDAPKLPRVAPSVSTAHDAAGKSTAIYGVGGQF